MKNKVVIITGGSSGIGKALAEKFGTEGSKIVITGRNLKSLESVEIHLKKNGIDVLAIQADVSKEDENKIMVKKTITHFQKIDILINNAGVSMRALFEETDLSVIRHLMDVNFYGAIYATKYCLPEIIANKGSILGISSIAGCRGLPCRVGYSASKFALQGFLESLRTELLYKGVHVLTVCPGFTASNIRKASLTKDGTTQNESPRNENKMMSAKTCAQYIYHATMKKKKKLILSSEGKLIVFLNKWLPSLADRIVYNAMAKEKDSPLKLHP